MDIDNFNILCACIYCTGCSSVKWMCWLLTIVVYLFCLFIKQVYFFKPKYSMLLIPLKAGDTSSPIRICNHIQHNIQVNKIAMILWFQVSFLSISLCMYNDFVIVPWQVLIYTFSDLYMSICEFSFSNMISYRIFSLKITKLYSFIHLFFSNKVVSEDVSKWLFWKVNREKYINIVMQKSYSTTSCSVIYCLQQWLLHTLLSVQ